MSLAAAIARLAQLLRQAGASVSPDKTRLAVEALAAVGLSTRENVYWALRAALISRADDLEVFNRLFETYWRFDVDPGVISVGAPEGALAPAARRAHEALLPPQGLAGAKPHAFEAFRSASSQERLRHKDFEQMSAQEMRQAHAALSQLGPIAPKAAGRRMGPCVVGGVPDWRATLRLAARYGGETLKAPRRTGRPRRPTLVALADISGSMSVYSRALLHFMHAATHNKRLGWERVESFVFGARLTRITRALEHRDVDAAVSGAAQAAPDWEGGTRIAESLRMFNRDWSARTLSGPSVVVFISDGLERGDPQKLAQEAARLRRRAGRVLWLNPLLRWDGFEPRARGVKALLPHVDAMLPGHNIASVEGLVKALNGASSEIKNGV